MEKKERIAVFGTGLMLLLIFTFTDLQISMAVATKPAIARALEVIGEIPFTILTMAGCAMLVQFRSRENKGKNIVGLLGGGVLFFLFSLMCGFMTWNYLCRNMGEISKIWIGLIGATAAVGAFFIARAVPEENGEKALRFAAMALVYFLLVLIIMNVLKMTWGRMRFREMTDPLEQFTRWYEICGRGGFSDVYASFPSGHSMNSAGVILMLLLPDVIPVLEHRKKLLHIAVYVWCILVGFSRVLMGAHFASDVIVGILLSFALFDLLSRFLYNRKRTQHK